MPEALAYPKVLASCPACGSRNHVQHLGEGTTRERLVFACVRDGCERFIASLTLRPG